MKKNIYCAILIFIFTMGCASKGTIVAQSSMSSGLSSYKHLALNTSTEAKKSDIQMVDLENLVMAKLRNANLFQSVVSLANNPETSYYDLILNMKIKDLKKVSTTSRIMFGMFAGRSKILVENELVDHSTGHRVGSFTAQGKSSGGTVFAGTTDQALEKVADQIVNFVQGNL